jgi:hypothetical protein
MARTQGAHERILVIAVTADESDDTLIATQVTFYRDRQSLDDGNGYRPGFVTNGASATHEIELGQTIPPPTVIRLNSTFQA